VTIDTTEPRQKRHGFTLVGLDGSETGVPGRGSRKRAPKTAGVMLAEIYDPARVTFPVAVQPKLDGVRATLSRDGLVTRDRLPIVSLPEITALGEMLPVGVVLDGEIWDPGWTLEEISAVVRAREPVAGRRPRLHAFDLYVEPGAGDPFPCPDATTWKDRADILTIVVHGLYGRGRMIDARALALVETAIVATPDDLDRAYARHLADGHEGTIVRDLDGAYVHGRSFALMRRKPFLDAEAALVAVVNGRKTGLPHTLVVRDLETGEKLTVAIQAMTEAGRRVLAANPPEPGRLVTYRWQPTASAHRRHRTLVRIHGPEGRL
jgi:DNA ligase-1